MALRHFSMMSSLVLPASKDSTSSPQLSTPADVCPVQFAVRGTREAVKSGVSETVRNPDPATSPIAQIVNASFLIGYIDEVHRLS